MRAPRMAGFAGVCWEKWRNERILLIAEFVSSHVFLAVIMVNSEVYHGDVHLSDTA